MTDALLQLVIRLLLDPATEQAIVRAIGYLLEQLPNADRDFDWGCADIVRGIRRSWPDWPAEKVARYARGAIEVLAQSEGRSLDPQVFVRLGIEAPVAKEEV